jgi:hypothetical protein
MIILNIVISYEEFNEIVRKIYILEANLDEAFLIDDAFKKYLFLTNIIFLLI